MFAVLLAILGFGFLYFWLRGWWFTAVAMALVWFVAASHDPDCGIGSYLFILAVSFAPMLGWMAWHRRARIYNVFAEANGWPLRRA